VRTAAAGVADWVDTDGEARRVGFVHAAGNVAALGLYSLSWAARRRGRHGRGAALSMAATAPQPAYEARITDDKLEVRLRQ